ncbi:hypothetical protein SGQ44_17110 [Flavobacterium sp. Fl-77]|uniref:Uncharacterized protein n=1 Tax=Flavobacterium flavipigmentatum TaxID=2893884 RepID=A0AAJ2SFH1_9FLAO|nr:MULTISPECIES: hypothetical protein [unclassified Flavobacterium]MDX6183953.1 hypothetical protein [Flavobacterium sp. Fl-33]MDX6187481.1 hypothetical protein [Flavobacterium sp. Fl-77]UFH37680.1 hypothetical protein LNP22_13135 [Flavobacterium sp. F-70]
MKDIEKDLIENAPSKGSQTDMDTEKSDEDESDSFETIAPEKDNPGRKEFEIGELGNQELQEDKCTRDASGHGALGNTKPCQRKFYYTEDFMPIKRPLFLTVFLLTLGTTCFCKL